MVLLFTFLQIERGKLHGCIDVGLSVMSVKKSTKCIDLDTEEQIYHLKVGLKIVITLLPGYCISCVGWSTFFIARGFSIALITF